MVSTIKFGPQNLSALVDQATEGAGSYYGVVVDKFCANRIKGVERISFLAALDETGQFSFDVMDTLIHYRQVKAEVFLEVPFDFPMLAADVLILVNSIGAGVIITPPLEKSPENWSAWAGQVRRYASALVGIQAFSAEVLPVTSYVQYMSMKVMGYTPQGLTDDPMMHRYFEQDMNTEVMSALKSDLEKIILDGVGGPDAFEQMVQSTLLALREVVVNEGKSRIERFREIILNSGATDLEPFIGLILEDLGHGAEKEVLTQGIVEIVTDEKQADEIEHKLLERFADLSSSENAALQAFIRFIKAITL